jgi:phage tail protein X
MSGRYSNLSTQKDSKGRRHIPAVLYPNIPYNPQDIYVRTVPGDRLDLLAYQFYKNVSYWWIIAHANDLGKGTLTIPEGSQVRIPANPQSIQVAMERLNNRG